MRAVVRGYLFSLLLLTLGAVGLPAQQIIRPEAMDLDHPKAQKAMEVVQFLLAGDADAALAHLEQNATSSLRESGRMAEQVRELVALIGTDGAYLIDNVMDMGQPGLIVRLRHTAGGEPLALVLFMESRAPYRIDRLQRAQMQMRVQQRPRESS